MQNAVFSLTDPDAQRREVSGSKAATLAVMKAAGLRVPPGFIVSTEVFADSLRDVTAEIDGSLNGLRATNLDAIQEIGDRARQA